MKRDNWGLKELFNFDEKPWIIHNDTENVIMVMGPSGQEISINPGTTMEFHARKKFMIYYPNKL